MKNMRRTTELFPALIAAGVLLSGAGGMVRAGEKPSLKEAFKIMFLVGAAVNDAQFSGTDSIGAAIVCQQFNTITPENVLKWESVHPEPGRYDFDAPDRYVAFGEKNHMFIVGHTLVWHNQTPGWVFQDAHGNPIGKEALLERLRDHIHTVVGRYKGRIKGWDVVNEAIVDDGSYKQSMWYKIIGEEYLVNAYRFAHEADPDAELYYNDFHGENAPKRKGIIRVVKMLQAAGVKVAGIGIQCHHLMDWPTTGQLDSAINEFHALGPDVMITELDVDILPNPDLYGPVTHRFPYEAQWNIYKNGLPDSMQQALAGRYAELFRVFVHNSDKITRVTLWGVQDGFSWLNDVPIPGRTNYPLLFDRQGKAKPAFDAVLETARNE